MPAAPRAILRNHERIFVVVVLASLLASASMLSIGPYRVRAAGGLVAEWPLNEGSGTTVADSVGTANGTLAGGASWLTTGTAEGTGAIHFDGIDGAVTVPDNAALDVPDLTLTVWVRGDPLDPPAVGATILEKGAFDCAGPSYGLYVAAGGIRFSYRSPSQNTEFSGVLTAAQAHTTLWDGGWHLVSAAVDRNQAAGYVSIDGWFKTDVAGGTWVPNSPSAIAYSGASNSVLRLGAPLDSSCGAGFFHGDLDDPRVYSDPSIDSGTLMAPITTAVSVDNPGTIHPNDNVPLRAVVSPSPRQMGQVNFAITRPDDPTWLLTISGGIDPDGVATANYPAVTLVGSFQIKAITKLKPPYVNSESAPASFDATPIPTTTTVSITPATPLPTQPVMLKATISSSVDAFVGPPNGTVDFYEDASSPVHLGAAASAVYDSGTATANLSVPAGFDVGSHGLYATFTSADPLRANSSSDTLALVIDKAPSTLYLSGQSPVETHHSFVLTASIATGIDGWATGATVGFYPVGSTTAICLVAVNPSNETTCTVGSQTIGTHSYLAKYSGNASVAASTSTAWNESVVADTVHAHGVGVSSAVVYPVVDHYYDTVTIKGYRDEPISVSIAIYSPSGALVRSASILSGVGAYNYVWNGFNAGLVLPEGTYRIVQTLRDAFATTLAVTSYVTLSRKHLAYHTSYVTKLGSGYSAKGSSGGGTVTTSTTGGYVLLNAGTTGTGWAGVGWEFTIPAATLYTAITFQVYARHPLAVPSTNIAVQRFTTCAYAVHTTWYETCFVGFTAIGNAANTTAWYSVAASVTYDRSGRIVRGLVSAHSYSTYVYQARVRVSYATLVY